MSTENLESIKRRVQKLLAIAEHERSDPNEAAAAAGMAERIMRKHQLEYSQVIMTALKKGDDLATEEIVCGAKTNGTKVVRVPLWVGRLAVAIAQLNDCGAKVVWTEEREAATQFFGYTADVQVSRWMLEFLVATVNRLCNEFKKTAIYAAHGRPAVNSYRHGLAIGIITSLNELTKAKAVEACEATTGTSLMVVKQQAIETKYGKMETRVTKNKLGNGNSFGQGVIDGRKVQVGTRALNESTAKPLLR